MTLSKPPIVWGEYKPILSESTLRAGVRQMTREKTIEATSNDGMGLSPADFHQNVRPIGEPLDFGQRVFDQGGIPKLG